MQLVLLAVALNGLLRMGRAEQFLFSGAAVAPGRLRCGHPEADGLVPELSGRLI